MVHVAKAEIGAFVVFFAIATDYVDLLILLIRGRLVVGVD